MKKLAKELPLDILIAEDNIVNQKLMLDVLDLLGYKCDAAADGFEVLNAVKEKKYDLILMDIQMPEMSGEEAARKVRAAAAGNPPKIIAVTAYAMAEDRRKYLEAGMNGYLSKPFKIDELIAEIKRVMKKG